MNKVFIKLTWASLLLAAASITVITNSCDQSKDIARISTEDQAFSELNKNIESMSRDFFKDSNIVPATRWWLLSRLWDAVKADCGSIIDQANANHDPEGGSFSISEVATASKKAYEGKSPKKVSYSNGSSETRVIIDSLLNEYAVSASSYNMAKAHNMVILKMYKDDFEDNGVTEENIIKARSILVSNALPVSSTSTAEEAASVDEFISNYNKPGEGGNLAMEIIMGQNQSLVNPIRLLNTYFSNVERLSSLEDILRYNNLFISQVNGSSISPGSKRLLIETVKLAAASYDLWSHIDSL